MPEFIIKGSTKALLADLAKRNKQLRFATAVALTKTAVEVRKDLQAEQRRVFDRPKPWTLNSMYVKPATKQILEAHVGHKDFAPKGTAAGKYLQPQIEGGQRPLKRFEKLLQARGLLPAGMYAVPGKGVRLDQYGNMSVGQLQQVLSNLGAQFDAYQNTPRVNAKGKRSQKRYFAATISGTPGIWERLPAGVRPVIVFVRSPSYRQRYDFFGVAQRSAERHLPRQADAAIRRAMETVR